MYKHVIVCGVVLNGIYKCTVVICFDKVLSHDCDKRQITIFWNDTFNNISINLSISSIIDQLLIARFAVKSQRVASMRLNQIHA